MKGYIKVRANQVRRSLDIYQEDLSKSREAYHEFKEKMEATECRTFFIWKSNVWESKYCDDVFGASFVVNGRVIRDCPDATLYLSDSMRHRMKSIESLLFGNSEVLLDDEMMRAISRFGGLTND